MPRSQNGDEASLFLVSFLVRIANQPFLPVLLTGDMPFTVFHLSTGLGGHTQIHGPVLVLRMEGFRDFLPRKVDRLAFVEGTCSG